ncbi:MAG: PEP-CTERM sorting domain-containing protein [Planctomycetota bacterium]
MKKLSLLIAMALVASSASAAMLEDFEAWTGAGTVVVDPDDAGNSALHLAGGETIAIPVPETAGVVTIDVYDMGAIEHDAGEDNDNNSGYGPRWGVATAGNGASAAASIVNKTFLEANGGYGYGADLSRTGSWWSPMWFGGPRLVDSLAVIGEGTWDDPDVPGDGAWATWTFTIASDGNVTIDNDDNSKTMAMGPAAEVWLSGGRSDFALNGTALFDNVTFVPEPATLGLLALGGLGLIRRRRA